MIRQVEREQLVGELYTAVDQPDHLESMLKVIANHCGASCGSFLSSTAEVGTPLIMATYNHDPLAVDSYNRHFKEMDMPAQFAQAKPLTLLHTSQLFKEHPQTRSDEFEERFIARFPYLHYRLGFAFESQGDSMIFALHRSKGEGDFEDVEGTFNLLNYLKPHIVRSSQLAHRLQLNNNLLKAVIDLKQRDDQSILYFDRGLRCVYASGNLPDMLQPFTGKLRWTGKELVYLDPALKKRVDVIMNQLAQSANPDFDESIFLWMPHSLEGLRVRFVRVTNNAYGLEQGLMVNLSLLNRRIPESSVIQATYGLTAAETRLTIALLMGDSASDYAGRHKLSVATVRAQIRAIFNKVGVSRQADLIRHLMNLY